VAVAMLCVVATLVPRITRAASGTGRG